MARAENTEFIDLFEEFYRDYYRNEIGELAQKYPNDQKSLFVDYQDLYRFDPDLAEDYRNKPDQLQEYAEEALRLFDLPIDVKLGQAHVRMTNLPESTDIRDIRADHRGQLVSIQGIIRKATEVRPKITDAAFECQRCGTLTRIPQSTGDFQEPHECQGCERQGPFRINFDQSEFIDAQKLRVQESPEGLRGGETPQNIDVNIEDDITGNVTAGDHVRVTGVLKLDQRGNDREKSAMFDVYMNGVSVEIEDEEFEEMDIDEDDKKEIVALSEERDIYEQMTDSIAPSIYGYDQEKLAIALQLFSGVTKHLPDESRIRGDLHVLLIGDPGTGKCQKYDTNVTLADGTRRALGDIVESNLDDPVPVDDGWYDTTDFQVQTLGHDGTVTRKRVTKVWKREAPEKLYTIRSRSGREVTVTPSHPLFVQSGLGLEPRTAETLAEGDFLAAPRRLAESGDDRLSISHYTVDRDLANHLETPSEITPRLSRLLGYIIAEGHVTDSESNGSVVVTNADEEILEDVSACCESLGLRTTRRAHHTRDSVDIVTCSSVEFVDFLHELEPAIHERSAEQRVPDPLFRASLENKRAFLRAYVDSEGTVSPKEREIAVASMSRELLDGVQALLLAFGINAHLESRQNGSYRLRISGTDFRTYVDRIGFVTDRKATASRAFTDTPSNTNTDVIPGLSETLREVREALALTQTDCGVPRTTYQHYERGDRNPSRESLRAVVDAFEERLAWLKDQRDGLAGEDWETIVELRDELGISQQSLADGMDVTQTAISYYERNEVAPDGGETVAASGVVCDRLQEALAVESTVDRLGDLATNDVRWDRISSIETVEPDDEWVYDLEVEGTHSYVSNGVVSHNSQILQYIRHIAPRSVFTSGKGSSSAGLTAAAVRDDFGDGQQWTLEAGALVLADRGIAAVDELDKMRCVTGDTLVQAGDGQRRIRKLASEAAKAGSIEELPNGRTIRDVDLDVWTMTDDNTLTKRPVTAIHEYDAPETLYEVTLSTGEAVTVTPDHPFFIEQDSGRVETPAEELQPGDQVYVPEGATMATDGGTAQIDTSSDRLGPAASGLGDIGLRTVEHVESVPDHDYDSVYDLTVEGTHNFLANGMVVHNSEDRSAMHEALEQQSISISKAGINATLKSRCSLLGAANPKYGRFDQYEPIGEQIDLEPALISRFDLIFTVTDEPDEEADAELAEHILRTNYAGELNTHREQNSTSDYSAEEVANVTDTVAPEIDPELLRKYVAFAKRDCFPTMTEEAKAAIRDFYVELRTKGSGEDAPVPVTARKLEALVRLAEASARVRLSDTVEEEDAERVIGIVRSSLEDIGIDPETGELDADVVETGTSKSQRDRIKNIRGIIADIEEEYDEGAPVDVVIERAEEVGMEASKAEHEIEKLKQQGEVYEPRTDHLRTT
ncbi:Putative ATPase involved in replication control,Cdc46/Mcm family [Halorhabdus sp. SVX81]|uniref:LAGLIDADG family homing endonuclease n=1 Tax=Halorhabdus sp. SVX81 TaxID=2978283 RepID=UPI0023D98280|nr:LAGLIDADG family homing endonuclease [Halorhabdus sp. SVX81]WEL18562.1 Putative ATPase involved in replication control,Cdc46/Mcm family [Halorhabdus sp. SVX81]